MSHEWIFDVLRDLRDYALRNDLVATAAKAEEALRVAQVEIADFGPTGPPGTSGKPH